MSFDLTIAICAYNAAPRLECTLRALAEQRVPAGVQWELLFVDNASTDETAAKANELAKKWKLPLRLISQPTPGKIHAIRTAVTEAAAPILSFLDDDNLVEPDWIEQVLNFLAEHPNAGLVGPRIDAVFEDPASVPADFEQKYAHALAVRNMGDQPVRLAPPDHDGPPGAGMTGRTALFRSVLVDVACRLSGPKAGKLTRGEDSEISLIAWRLGWEMWYVPAMRMGHLLPPSRLKPEYIDRLIAEGSESSAWLDYLRQVEPRKSRSFYFRRWAICKLQSYKMGLLEFLRRSSPQGPRLRFWKNLLRNRAAGYWELGRDYPFEDFERSLAEASKLKPLVEKPFANSPKTVTAG
jgi:glycosyltransferase involved in cell wall biosynthesis